VLVDHASNEVWYDAARRMDRFDAADLLREGLRRTIRSAERAVAAGLALRYDGGSCFRSDHYQAEIDHLGIARSPAFHYEPETNGCAEKAIQALKEQVLWIERFDTLDELPTAVRAFRRSYNQQWLIERHGYRTPTEAREDLFRERVALKQRPEGGAAQRLGTVVIWWSTTCFLPYRLRPPRASARLPVRRATSLRWWPSRKAIHLAQHL
jgi:hypothetical protein